MSKEVWSLIEAAGLKGPYVLVGHSFGGMIVRLIAPQCREREGPRPRRRRERRQGGDSGPHELEDPTKRLAWMSFAAPQTRTRHSTSRRLDGLPVDESLTVPWARHRRPWP